MPAYMNPGIAPTTGGGNPSPGGYTTPGVMGDISAGVGAAGSIYSLINSIGLQRQAGTVLGQSNPFGGYRPYYGNQLLQLMQDPSSVTKLPGYDFLMGQGTAAIDRSAAAPGGVGFGSTAEKGQLEQYGQGLADQFYQQQVATLSGLAGANISPANPAAALSAAGGAATGLGSSITGIQSTLGLLSKMFPGVSGGSAPAYDQIYNDPTYQTALGMMAPGGGGSPAGSVTPGIPYDQGGGMPDLITTAGDSGGGIDLSGLFSGPKTAGGVAATSAGGSSTGQTIGTGIGTASNLLNIIQGVKTGGVSGYGQAGIGTAAIAARGLGAVGAISGATANEIMSAAGYAAIPLSVYNFAKNWQSGATGSDVLGGASAGASIGTAIMPGVGTLIGLGAGALVGGVSSAFGPGRMDPENVNWNSYAAAAAKAPQSVAGATPSQNFQALAGIFDARGSNIPFYKQFGRMGENQFTVSMANQINSALRAGQIPVNASPQQIYSQIVQPWITKMGGEQGWQQTYTEKGAPEKGAIGDLLTNLISQWQQGALNSSTPVGVSGQAIAGLPSYGG